MRSIFTIAFAIAAMTITGSLQAQGFGGFAGATYGGGFDSFGGTSFGSVGNYGNYGLIGPGGPNDCGRGYTNQQAASLWSGYCTESCVSKGCGLFGKKCGGGGCGLKRARSTSSFGYGSAFGYPSGGSSCGCSQGCFGYPSSCGCNTGGCSTGGCSTGGGRRRGGCLSRLLGKFHRGGAGSCHRCSLGGFRLFRRHRGGGGGCKLFKCRKSSYTAITTYPVTTVAVDQCGCGSSGQYFDYAVGAEYGTAGIESSISGEITGACSSCGDAGGYDMGGYDTGGYDTGGDMGMPMNYDSADFSLTPMVDQSVDMLPQY